MRKNVLLMVLGAAVGTAGVVLLAWWQPNGLWRTLPFVCIGIGFGVFGQGLGEVLSLRAKRKNPTLAKHIEIEQKDERNIALSNRAKARTYDFFLYLYCAIVLTFTISGIGAFYTFALILSLVAVWVAYFYYFNKYQNEM